MNRYNGCRDGPLTAGRCRNRLAGDSGDGGRPKLGLDRLIDPAPYVCWRGRRAHPHAPNSPPPGGWPRPPRVTLAETLALGLDEDDLYAAMDWLLESRQDRIERGLAKRHLARPWSLRPDLWMEGRTCPLERGHDGKPRPSSGSVRADGCPVSFAGHIADPSTVGAQVGKLRQDRGMYRGGIRGQTGGAHQRAARAGHPRALRRGAVVAVRRARPGGGHQRRLPRGASDGVPQSAVGRGAREEARRPARRHRGGARPPLPRRTCRQKSSATGTIEDDVPYGPAGIGTNAGTCTGIQSPPGVPSAPSGSAPTCCLHAGLLRGMAHARAACADAVRRRGPRPCRSFARRHRGAGPRRRPVERPPGS